MTFNRIIRPLTLASLCLLLAAPMSHAQRGGGGGPGGGGPGGGGPGGGPGGGGPGGSGGNMGGPGNGGFGPPGAGNMGGMGGNRNAGAPPSGAAMRSGPQLALPGRWWDDRKTVRSLGLRPDQQQRMDDIFNTNRATLQNLLTNLQHEETRLSSMSSQDLQDQDKVYAAIDRVARARAELQKENVHILLQIRKEMDPQQLAALDRAVAESR